jgi:hypothetical protein
MRRDHGIIHFAEGMVERQRFDVEHVETGAGNGLRLQCRDKGLLIDNGPTRRVDQVSGLFHQTEFLGPDQAA